MLMISREELQNNINVTECIELMEETLKKLSSNKAVENLRNAIGLEDGNIFALMPGFFIDENIAGVKVITVFHDNFKKKLPSHQGIVSLFETETGKPVSIVDGGGITALRTAAVSAAATRKLSRVNSRIMAILGAGVQAREHLKAILKVRKLEEIRVWSIFYYEALEFSKKMSEECNVKVVPLETVEDAVRDADIICTVTSAKEPILERKWVKQGTHINAVGACSPNARELDTALMKEGKIFVDRIESTLKEAGDFIIPLNEEEITIENIAGEIGDVFSGRVPGRKDDGEITIFEALGLAVEDIACANYVYKKLKDSKEQVWI